MSLPDGFALARSQREADEFRKDHPKIAEALDNEMREVMAMAERYDTNDMDHYCDRINWARKEKKQ